MASAPSMAIQVSFGMCKFAFANAAIIFLFTYQDFLMAQFQEVLLLITQSFNTDCAIVAN